MEMHKKKPLNFRNVNVDDNRLLRTFNRRDERQNAKHVRLSSIRGIDPNEESVENGENLPQPKARANVGKEKQLSRLEMLDKWKKEKELKKKLEAAKKPQPFKVRAVTYKAPPVLASSSTASSDKVAKNVTMLPSDQSASKFKKPLPISRAQPSRFCKVPGTAKQTSTAQQGKPAVPSTGAMGDKSATFRSKLISSTNSIRGKTAVPGTSAAQQGKTAVPGTRAAQQGKTAIPQGTAQQNNSSSPLMRSNTFVKANPTVPAANVPSVGKPDDTKAIRNQSGQSCTNVKRCLSFAPKTFMFAAPKQLPSYDLKKAPSQPRQKSFMNFSFQENLSKSRRLQTNNANPQPVGKSGLMLPASNRSNLNKTMVNIDKKTCIPKLNMTVVSALGSPATSEELDSFFAAQKARIQERSMMNASAIHKNKPVELPAVVEEPAVKDKGAESTAILGSNEEKMESVPVLEKEKLEAVPVVPEKQEEIESVPVVPEIPKLESATSHLHEFVAVLDKASECSGSVTTIDNQEQLFPIDDSTAAKLKKIDATPSTSESVDEKMAQKEIPGSSKKRTRKSQASSTPRPVTRQQRKISLLGTPMTLRSSSRQSVKGNLITFSPST